MATDMALLTAEEFRKLEDPPGVRLDLRQVELRQGNVVMARIPSQERWGIQKRLASMIEAAFGTTGEAGIAFPFRPNPGDDLRLADVAWISNERLARIDQRDNLIGAPDLVVEVVSRHDLTWDVLRLKHTCMDSGCTAFWIADPHYKLIEVNKTGSPVSFYREGDHIQLAGSSLSVNRIFASVAIERAAP